MPSAWSEVIGNWLPSSGYAATDAPSFEVYVDDCSKVAPAELRTELFVPVERPSA